MAYLDYGEWRDAGHPRWLADETTRDHLVPGPVKLNVTSFPLEGTVVVTTTAAAAAAATTVPVSALSGPIPSGAILDFTGTGEFAKLISSAQKGATSLSVEALDAAIESGDSATFQGSGKRYVRSGTAVSRTTAQRDANVGFRPAVATDDEVFILRFGIEDLSENNDGVLLRPNSVVKENFLPEVMDGTMDEDVLDVLRTRYICQKGAA